MGDIIILENVPTENSLFLKAVWTTIRVVQTSAIRFKETRTCAPN
jgi:hypothetical protein